MKNPRALPWWRRLLLVAVLTAGVAAIIGSGGGGEDLRPDNPRPIVGPPTEFRLTVQIDALGSGAVSSVPTGIDTCRSDCSANFAIDADVTLTAVPDPGHTFGPGWQLNAAQAKASDFADLQTAAALAADGRLLVAYTQSVGVQRRVGVLRENLEAVFASVFGNLPDVNATQGWSADAVDMALDASDQPILATLADLDDVRVDHWIEANGNWHALSARVNGSGGQARSPQIGIAGNQPGDQTVIVAWVENERIGVRRYSMASQSWNATDYLAGVTGVRSVRMMLDSRGMPVLAYWSGTLNVIRETAPGVWSSLGGAINNEPTDVDGAASFGVHVDAGDAVRVAWVEGIRTSGAGPWSIYARRFDGANWVSAFTNNATGFVFNAGQPAERVFPTALGVARNPSVFAFAAAWDLFATGGSDVRVLRVAANGALEENPVPIGDNGLYRRARNVSLAMQDAGRAVVASSHNEGTVTPPFVLQVRRFFP